MICTNCYKSDYRMASISKPVSIAAKEHVLNDVACLQCPKCQEVVFTHEQSIEFERRRLILEFKEKPMLTPRT